MRKYNFILLGKELWPHGLSEMVWEWAISEPYFKNQ